MQPGPELGLIKKALKKKSTKTITDRYLSCYFPIFYGLHVI
jgi:hypothetical protein